MFAEFDLTSSTSARMQEGCQITPWRAALSRRCLRPRCWRRRRRCLRQRPTKARPVVCAEEAASGDVLFFLSRGAQPLPPGHVPVKMSYSKTS